ncbi:hypothetical protein [Paraburkholderia sp. EG304]|uniref:hypothetical protein n=1 Tax=Paraburkholderia sp. EG304 TaxID=3237015 RepID=UPI00397CBE1E
MASSTQTRCDSDVGEKPGARMSLSASKTAHKIACRRFGELVDLVRGPIAALSAEQNLRVKRDLLESLSRRAVYWMALALLGSLFELKSGYWIIPDYWIKASDIYRLFRVAWIFGLWGMAAPMAIYLLKRTMALPKHADVNAVEQMHGAWAALVILTSVWWAAGSFGLIPLQFQFHGTGSGRIGFLELTLSLTGIFEPFRDRRNRATG